MSTQAATADAVSNKTPLLKSRLGSFLAVVPLSIWVVNHLWNNLSAFDGAAAWQQSVTTYSNPYSQVLTFVIVILPLLFHTGWGIVRLFSFKPNNGRYNNYGNLKYLLQRVSALGVLAFLGAHIWLAFLRPRLLLGHPELFSDIAQQMHFHTPTLAVYLLGTLGTAYHLANGLQGFAMGWGLLGTERSMRRFEPVALALFALLTAMSWGVIYALYTAGASFGPPA
ncbi:succinate dehydrogenase [Myxococcus landrumensis]|uniref:Succinate dehydrogenase n=1 Tax=Myxococcus landrumensis TaxID=2813577 RepID=A0ABX7MWY4_9BACT|nr:succinate dehydrogenase [Myxococcus landrumus]QSQ10901.1 succinate dehydrogenase [Myxococcus landrumus]